MTRSRGSAELWLASDFRPVPNAKVPLAKPVSRGRCPPTPRLGSPRLMARLDRPTDCVITCGDNGKAVVPRSPRCCRPTLAALDRDPVGWGCRSGGVLSHGTMIFWADFSPDGRYVATAGRDRGAGLGRPD